MDVVILCGGRGTRLQERTADLPKPLVEIGGVPILDHVMRLYADQGLTSFLLLTGYRGELIERHVARTGFDARCLDTGQDTPTGGRLALARDHVRGDRLCVTYADGLADIDLAELLAFHAAHGALATMTVVRPELQFGITELTREGRVTGFEEKPHSRDWVNGGFFVFERGVLDRLEDDSVLERGPLQALAAEGELHAFRHTGFWKCMDTYKDAVALNDLWASGAALWRRRR
jgi:glucose-1-phosphate cytidylyltransferase